MIISYIVVLLRNKEITKYFDHDFSKATHKNSQIILGYAFFFNIFFYVNKDMNGNKNRSKVFTIADF